MLPFVDLESSRRALAHWLFSIISLALLAACVGSGDEDLPPAQSPPLLSPHACLVEPLCPQVMVAAHRGDHSTFPENSLAALRSAAELGADFVEVDVRHTADEILILMHDGDVDRTTDGSGAVDALTWSEVQVLHLTRGDPSNPESARVPRFDEAVTLARDLGVMVYVDKKTDRGDLVTAVIRDAEAYEIALVRDGLTEAVEMAAADARLLVMPAVQTTTDLDVAQGAIPHLQIVELSQVAPDSSFVAHAKQAGIKVQQDVMAGDIGAAVGNYTVWKSYVEAGVSLMQSDLPHKLVLAVGQYNETGSFPDR